MLLPHLAARTMPADQTLPNLVITDVVMPRMGGRGLAEAMPVRGIVIPVPFMSG